MRCGGTKVGGQMANRCTRETKPWYLPVATCCPSVFSLCVESWLYMYCTNRGNGRWFRPWRYLKGQTEGGTLQWLYFWCAHEPSAASLYLRPRPCDKTLHHHRLCFRRLVSMCLLRFWWMIRSLPLNSPGSAAFLQVYGCVGLWMRSQRTNKERIFCTPLSPLSVTSQS